MTATYEANHGWLSRRGRVSLLLATSAWLLIACGGGSAEDARTDSAGSAMDDMGSMQGMPGMGGMAMGMDSGMMARMNQMNQHMTMMRGLAADSMKAMLPLHRQMTANELAEMGQEMQKMKMATDSTWDALVDSIRTDLRTMPDMASDSLHRMMPMHVGRMMRLMQMHHDMMMKMGGKM